MAYKSALVGRASAEEDRDMAIGLAGHAAARVLRQAGIPWVSGVSGESFLPLLEGLRLEGIPFLPFGHESGAVFAAATYARTAGRPGVVAVTRGPGASNALIGVHEAAQAGTPLILIVGQLESAIRGRRAMQEMEMAAVFGTVAKATFEVTSSERVGPSIAAALRTSQAGRPGPVVVTVPADYFFGRVVDREGVPLPESPPEPVLSEGVLARLAGGMSRSRRGLLIAGSAFSSGRHAAHLGSLAARSGFGVLGGHAHPDVLPGSECWLGCSSLRGSEELRETLGSADLIVLLGHWLGDRVSQGYLALGARVIAIDTAFEPGWDEYLDAEILPGDPVAAVRELDRVMGDRPEGAEERHAWVRSRRSASESARSRMLERAREVGAGVASFTEIIGALDAELPREVTIVSDAGSFNDWVLRYLPFPQGRHYLGPISGSMGFGVPGAIGAQLGRTAGRAVALVGDGGFLMTGLELATAVALELPVTIVVFRNGIWGSIALHQDRLIGRRTAVDLPTVSFSALASAVGALGISAEGPGQVAGALRRAFAHPGPALVEIQTDPVRPSPSSYGAS